MSGSWLMALGLFFAKMLSWLRGRGYRVSIEVRPEAAIEAEKKRLDKLTARIRGIDNELQETVIKLVQAKRHGDMAGADSLDAKREWLFNQLHEAQRDYDDARGRSPDGRRSGPV